MRGTWIVGAALALTACQTTTSDTSPATRPTLRSDYLSPKDGTICGDIANLAAVHMEMRQRGVPISKALQPLGTSADDLARTMTLQAYARPAFSTQKYQDEAIREFGAEWRLSCERVK